MAYIRGVILGVTISFSGAIMGVRVQCPASPYKVGLSRSMGCGIPVNDKAWAISQGVPIQPGGKPCFGDWAGIAHLNFWPRKNDIACSMSSGTLPNQSNNLHFFRQPTSATHAPRDSRPEIKTGAISQGGELTRAASSFWSASVFLLDTMCRRVRRGSG